MPHSILIVEDNPVTCKMLRLALEREHYAVSEAHDGQTALRLLEERRPAMILQDLMLPDMSGLDLIAQLRALPATAEIPILCYSGLIGPDERRRVLDAGFTDLVHKPVPPTELMKIVQSHLPASALPAVTPEPLAGRHILLADDDSTQCKLWALRLRSAGARVTVANNGNEALARARADPPDAILSDVLMPECDGFGLCSALRADPQLADVPVVLMSARVETEDVALAQKLGANALVARTADASLAALAASLTAPAPIVNDTQSPVRHLDRMADRTGRQANGHARSVQTQTLYGIFAGFLDHLAEQTSGGDLEAKLDDVLLRYLDACGYPTGALYLIDANGKLAPRAVSGVSKHTSEAWLSLPQHHTMIVEAMERGTATAWSAQDPERSAVLRMVEAESMVLCPLRTEHQPLGILVLCSKRRSFDPEWLALAQAAAGPISQTIAFVRTRAALTASEQRFRGVAESLADGVVITDERGQIVYANAAVETLFGYPAGALYGTEGARLTPMLTTRAGVWAGRANHRDGQQIPVNGSTAVVHDPGQPDRANYAHVIHDLSVHEHLEQVLHLANHDALTQAFNRRAFDEELKRCLSEAERYRVYGALLLLDLDHFKQINDRFGHAAGDAALMAFTGVLRRSIRQTDMLARLGGDEFAILAPHLRAEQVRTFALKLLEQLKECPAEYNGEPIRLSASIGIALYDAIPIGPAALLNSADQALYQAKQAGRGCCRLYDGGA